MIDIDRVYNEDCATTMYNMQNNSVDLTVTSPPYDSLRDYNGYSFCIDKLALYLHRVTKPGGVVVWIVGDATVNGSETGTSFRHALAFMDNGFNLHDTMIYYRPAKYPSGNRYNQCFEYMFIFSKGKPKTFNPVRELKAYKTFGGGNGRAKSGQMVDADAAGLAARKSLAKTKLLKTADNIWYQPCGKGDGLSSGDAVAFEHPAIFPEKLCGDHITSWSNPGDLVYDPFMGSGTTAKMAIKNNRHWIGSEISSEYCDIINRRLENMNVV